VLAVERGPYARAENRGVDRSLDRIVTRIIVDRLGRTRRYTDNGRRVSFETEIDRSRDREADRHRQRSTLLLLGPIGAAQCCDQTARNSGVVAPIAERCGIQSA
jgi:hypothetical protein